MKKYFHSVIKFTIGKARKSKLIQSLFEAPFDLDKFPAFGVFRDSYGHEFELKRGLRDQIKPAWQPVMVKYDPVVPPNRIKKMIDIAKVAIDKSETIINAFGKGIQDSQILEIGCHLGVNTFTFAEKGATLVTGTDYYEYKVQSSDDAVPATERLAEVRGWIEKNRVELAHHFSKSGNVRFINDDICATALPENTFDIVCSWDVLEHLHDPAAAMKNIASVLRPGGVCIHDYNPFFGLNGGHSFSTLDFLWGHVRLNEQDFIRYLEEVRPYEKVKAFSFYKKGLNRMSISDLESFSHAAGLEVSALIKFSREQHMRMVSNDILKQCQKVYPQVSYIDLVTPHVILVQRKGRKE